MKNLKQYFLGGLVFSGTVIISFIGFAAYTSLPTQGDGATITQTIWNDVIKTINDIGTKVDTLSNVPTGAIMAFNLSTCPDGWIAANGSNGTPDLRGEFIRGLDSGRGVDSGRTLASFQNDLIKTIPDVWLWSGNEINRGYQVGTSYDTRGSTQYKPLNWPNGNETRPRNVAFLYCIKN